VGRLEIHLDALRNNLRKIRGMLHKGVLVMAVVKADAYGHGIIPVSKTLESEEVDYFGVFDVTEGITLREAGIKTSICVLGGVRDKDEAEACVVKDLDPIIVDSNMLKLIEETAQEKKVRKKFFLKVDTGMGRLGVSLDELPHIFSLIKKLKSVELLGLASHFSSADEDDPSFTLSQIDKFKLAISMAQEMGFKLKLNHIANSAGTIRFKESHFQMVRAGIFLYGALPAYGFKTNILPEPLMTLKGEVLQVRQLPPNTFVSYCRTYRTPCPLKVAVISIGYSNGIFRSISNKGYCLIKGKRAPIIGNICMNLSICNVEYIEEVKKGDEVIFLGKQNGNKISPEELAFWAGTIPYEIFCSIGSKNKKVYIG